ncbi:MAG: hypothetical protein RIT45_4341 [Pseudomonadota bacterium]
MMRRQLLGHAACLLLLAGCGQDALVDSDTGDGATTTSDADLKDAESDTGAGDGVAAADQTGGGADVPGTADAVEDTAGAGVGSDCKSDKDCIGFDLVCDKTAGQCVACNGDVDCVAPDTCKAHVCVPPPKSCGSSKDCAELDQVCDKGAGFCVDCVGDDDCASGLVCQSTVCVAPLCKAGETRCKDNGTLEICSEAGDAWTATPCPAAQLCVAGFCKAQGGGGCSEGSTQCADAVTLLMCDAAGAWQPTICPGTSFCVSNTSGAICGQADCKPGTKVCQGDKVVECNAAGELGDLSDDCGATGKTCEAGACKEKPAGTLCTPGNTVCQGNAVATCDAAGAAWTTTACGSGSACEAGSCKPVVCTPAAKQCKDGKVQICNASGTGEATLEDCQSKGLFCWQGACSAQVCQPNSVGCQGDKLVVCNDTGSQLSTQACDDGDPCSKNLCVAGACNFTKPACDDGEPCTIDGCNSVTGACTASVNNGPCDDGDACTLATVCTVSGCKPAPGGEVGTLAGSGGTGAQNGAGTSATFSGTVSGVLAVGDVVYVADAGNHGIRAIAKDGSVSTYAGLLGTAGFIDGNLADARFKTPHGLAALPDGSIAVADTGNLRIRRISPQGAVSLWAGSGGSGSTDGPGSSASFNLPFGIVAAPAGGVYVTDSTAHRVREVKADGTVSTLVGAGAGFADGPLAAAKLKLPEGIARAANGALYVGDSGNGRVRRIAAGIVETVAGSGAVGSADGAPTSASFGNSLAGIGIDAAGNVVVVDSANHRLRRIAGNGVVSTLLGGTGGYADGLAAQAKLSTPVAITLGDKGRWIVSDRGNRRIRWMDPAVVDCDDGQGCTADSCDKATGTCKHTAIGAGGACEDGDGCTIGETCNAVGSCGGGKPKVCDDGDACTTDSCDAMAGGCVATLNLAPIPVSLGSKHDVLFWIDTSGSMAQEAKYLNDQLNVFQKLVPATADVRVVLFGNGFGICVQQPMGGPNCTDGPTFMHVKQSIGSTNGPNILTTNSAKFGSFLRPGAVQHVVAVTDDNQSTPSACSTPCGSANGGALGTACSDCKANWFMNSMNQLLPQVYAKNASMPYGMIHHSIVAYENKSDCPTIAQKGAAYLRMTELTGGEKMKVCDTSWAPFFVKLGERFKSGGSNCGFLKPAAPAGAGASGAFTVRIHTATGTTVVKPAAGGVCNGDGYTTSSADGKTTVTLCPQSCQAAATASLDVLYSCQ